jgi:bifunctional enzyme CysN/CysC
MTGLPGAGKSTLALALERALFELGWQVLVLDGDVIRSGLGSDLGFSAADRTENLRRVAHVAALLAHSGIVVIVAFISPFSRDRVFARSLARDAAVPFLEVYVSTPLEVCEARDPKSLYAKARSGAIKDFTGVSAPFEVPEEADVSIDTSDVTLADALCQLLGPVVATIAHRPAVTLPTS